MHHTYGVLQITEIAAISLLPNSVVQYRLNRPMRIHVAGTMLVRGDTWVAAPCAKLQGLFVQNWTALMRKVPLAVLK